MPYLQPVTAAPLRVENKVATSPRNDMLTYIKEHVESDLQTNKRISGVDLSHFLSDVLDHYVTALRLAPESYENGFMISFTFAMMALGPSVQRELGKRVWFHETQKAGLAILILYQEKGDASLDDVVRYGEELRKKVLSPEDMRINEEILEILHA